MSHSSGITASPELVEEFSRAKEGKDVRFLKAQIEDKHIVVTARGDVSGDEKSDFEAMTKFLDEDAPSYILFRIDEGSKPGWLLALYVPENSKVRMKMLYASSRDSLKRDLGSSSFVAEMHATDLEEMSYTRFQDTTVVSETERLSLMSPSERMRAKESNTHVHTGVSKSYVHAVKFPMSEDAKTALSGFKSNDNKAVFMQVEHSKESIELELALQEGDFQSVKERLFSSPEPKFLLFSHTAAGSEQATTVFVLYCPEGAKVREKMLYSTAKAAVCEEAEAQGISLDVKLEVREASDLTESELVPSSEAAESSSVPILLRPKGPGGARRGMVKLPGM